LDADTIGVTYARTARGAIETITDTATGYSSERGGLEVDAQIVVTPLELTK
jgi:hypothetical protein